MWFPFKQESFGEQKMLSTIIKKYTQFLIYLMPQWLTLLSPYELSDRQLTFFELQRKIILQYKLCSEGYDIESISLGIFIFWATVKKLHKLGGLQL